MLPPLLPPELFLTGWLCCRKFNAADVRTLRAAVSTFCDLLALVTRTLEMFGQSGEVLEQ